MTTISHDALAQMQFAVHRKSTTTAWLLWIFLAGFGAHMFYVRRPILGVLILLSGFSIPVAFGAFVGTVATGNVASALVTIASIIGMIVYIFLVFGTAFIINSSIRRCNEHLILNIVSEPIPLKGQRRARLEPTL